MRYFLVAALACCLMMACATSTFSLRGGEVDYGDDSGRLEKTRAGEVAGAYAVVEGADRKAYEAETRRQCLAEVTKTLREHPENAYELSAIAAQCEEGNSYGGYGVGGAYHPVPFSRTPGGGTDSYLNGVGWGHGENPHLLILQNRTKAFYASVRLNGQPIRGIIPPGEELWLPIRFPPPSPTNPRSEGRFSVETTWFSDPFGREPVGLTKTTPTFRPLDGGSRYALTR